MVVLPSAAQSIHASSAVAHFKVQQRVPKTSCDMEAYRAPVRASAKSNAGAGFDTVVPVRSHAVENIPCLQILMVLIIIIIFFELL